MLVGNEADARERRLMPNEEHVRLLEQGVEVWNSWRAHDPDIEPNLAEADFSGADLSEADLSGAKLVRANLRGTDLSSAYLPGAYLYECDLTRADLSEAFLRWADLSRAILTKANLSGADLRRTHLARTVFKGADLSGCKVYGIAAWDLQLDDAIQSDLIITDEGETVPSITVDNLEVAQFIYLLLKNEKLRDVIETMTSKAVLILGNFAPERKEILEAIRGRLRDRGYLPIMLDFEGPHNKNLIDTVTTVARLSRFLIVDITQPRSVPAELEAIVPALPSVPVQPLIEGSEEPYAMFSDLVMRDSVLKLHCYRHLQDLLGLFDDHVIVPAEKKVQELELARLRALEKL
jgi:uncharacterized protein YjbI with pentapeptide repeats